MFGISDKDLMDKNKIKILNGIAGSGKSTTTVNKLRSLGSNFCLASFSNALKFAASDKFGCPVDTICGLEFVNSPVPRYDYKEVTKFDTVINDEILLDGVECMRWMEMNVGKVNIIALTDSRQMLTAEGGSAALKEFKKLCNMKNAIVVDIDETKRAVNDKTKELYDKLYHLDSTQLYTVEGAKNLLGCEYVDIFDINFSEKDTFICHSNKIEHELYKRYGISDRRDIKLIPKNHISRRRVVDVNKYPICDQITATDKKINSYLQAANVATPTRFQGKEVEVGTNCYYFVQENDTISGRELYTVATRCKDIDSLKICVINISEVKDPKSIFGIDVVDVKHLSILTDDMNCRGLKPSHMMEVIKKYGKPGQAYYTDYVTCKDHIVYTSLPLGTLEKFAKVDGNEVIMSKKASGGKISLKSIVKKDTTMHFDFMEQVYNIIGMDIRVPRISNPKSKNDFTKLCDIYSAFPTILKHCEFPKAGDLYTNRDDNLMNFYIYNGDVVTKGSLITEDLANKLGDSRYVFSTPKQDGCKLGEYTYERCKHSKEAKAKINEDFKWGMFESAYYVRSLVALDGNIIPAYVKNKKNNLELVGCALWSHLSLIMLNAIDSIGVKEYNVATDGLFYNGDDIPVLPSWCDYRVMDLDWSKKKTEKYENIIFKTYDDPPTERELDNRRKREQRRVTK